MSDYESQSREAVSRLSDTQWRRVQRARRWLTIGSIACYVLAVVAGVYLILEARGIREGMLTDAARMRAETAEMRRQMDTRECERFPQYCRDRRSVFYQRPKVQAEKPATRR